MAQCQKYCIPNPEYSFSIEGIVSRILRKKVLLQTFITEIPKQESYRWQVIQGQRVNMGKKSYAEYLADYQRKHIPIESNHW